MLRLFCSLLLSGFLAGCQSSHSLELWSQGVYDGFGAYAAQDMKPMTIALSGSSASKLAHANNLATKVAAYGSGEDIWVDLVIDKGAESANQEDLIRTAMSSAMVFYQFVHQNSFDEDRPVRANIYMVYTNSYEYNVLLATASIAVSSAEHPDLTFPGPAWINVLAAEKLPNRAQIRYIQEMQLNRYDWGMEVDQEYMRSMLTAQQDVEISNKLHIPPGSVSLEPFVLKPIH